MSEIALISARKNRLETAAKKGNKNAKAALDLANSPNEFLSTVQIGITLIGILTGIYSELLNSIKSISWTNLKLLLNGRFKEFSESINLN